MKKLTVEECRELAIRLHGDQTDWAGQPYIVHLDGVVANLGPNATDIERMAGYLHDSEEDCRVDDGTPEGRPLTSDDLRAEGVEEEAIRLVEIVTKQENPEVPPPGLSKEEVLVWKDEQYFEGIRKIIATGNPSAMRLKLADNRHNGDPARDVHLKPSQLARSARYRERYNRSAQMLEAAIIELGAELPGPAPSGRTP